MPERQTITDQAVLPWRIDLHCAMSDGDGVRVEYDGEEGKGTPPNIAFFRIAIDESNNVADEYISQTQDLEAVEEFFLNAARFVSQTRKRWERECDA